MSLPNKNFLSNIFIIEIFLFVIEVILVLVMTLAIYLLCKHKRTKNTNNQSCFTVKVGTVSKQEDVPTACSCKIQFYIILMLSISILGLVIFAVLCYPTQLK